MQCDGTNTGYLDAPVIVRCAALHCAVRRSCTRVPGRYCYITAQDRTSRTRRGGCRTFRGSAALPCPALPCPAPIGRARLPPGAWRVCCFRGLQAKYVRIVLPTIEVAVQGRGLESCGRD